MMVPTGHSALREAAVKPAASDQVIVFSPDDVWLNWFKPEMNWLQGDLG